MSDDSKRREVRLTPHERTTPVLPPAPMVQLPRFVPDAARRERARSGATDVTQDARAARHAARRDRAVEDLRHAARRSEVARLVLADLGFFEGTDLGSRLADAVASFEDLVDEILRRHGDSEGSP